ncbi:MAG: ArsR family transcriptional regulator [Euryarchaeota archaeon]|nr:ArsR family transcriptional regulator [Euryarchaeota archaeon]
MARLFEKPVSLDTILTLPAERAMALEDPLRALLLNLLAEESLSVEEMVVRLRRRNIRKAPTTVRHHLEILKRAGLVELTRAEEARGGVLKYYAANSRVLGYDLTPEAEGELQEAIGDAEGRIEKVLREVLRAHRREIKRVADGLKDCPYCPTPHFVEYTALKVLERATARAAQRMDWKKV